MRVRLILLLLVMSLATIVAFGCAKPRRLTFGPPTSVAAPSLPAGPMAPDASQAVSSAQPLGRSDTGEVSPSGPDSLASGSGASISPPLRPNVLAHAVTSTGFRPAPELRDVHFDFNDYRIRADQTWILDANAREFRAHPESLVLVEGHADERGTNEYNLALAAHRAQAVAHYLIAQGVSANRLTLISYGEERPICTDKSQACWAKNRRVHFLVKPRDERRGLPGPR